MLNVRTAVVLLAMAAVSVPLIHLIDGRPALAAGGRQ
jgi:hypothetical protein